METKERAMADQISSSTAEGYSALRGLRHRGAPLAVLTMLSITAPLLMPAAAYAQAEPASDLAARRDLHEESSLRQPATKELTHAAASAADSGDARTDVADLDEADRDELKRAVKDQDGTVEGSELAPDEAQALAAVAPGGAADKSGASSQVISVPKGSGTIEGMGESFSAQLSTGIATFSVPFALPAARGGAQPSLGLSYSSSSGWGVAGQGWDVGAPFIARQTDRGVPGYDDRQDYWPGQDRFVFNGGQELVPICTVTGTDAAPTCDGALAGEEMPPWSLGSQYFRARVEGSFMRFFWSADHLTWRVQDKSGVTLELGVPLDASGDKSGILLNPEDPTKVARWALVRQYDTQGSANPTNASTKPTPNNVVVYRYHPQEPALLLTDIYDTSPSAAPTTGDLSKFAHHTHLEYETRPDPIVSYRLGFKLERRLRLKRVDVTSSTNNYGTIRLRQQLRRYHLDYLPGLNASLLASVQAEGRCGAGDELESSAPSEGVDGLLRASNCPRLPAMTFEYTQVAPFLGTGAATLPVLPGFAGFDERVREITSPPDRSVSEAEADFFDLNGDALPDFLVTLPGVYGNGFGQFLSSPGGVVDTFATARTLPMLGGASAGSLRLSNPNVAVLDMDGDGQVDLLHAPRAKTYSVYPLKSAGLIGRDVTTASQADLKIDFGRDAALTRVIDVNGDGLVDVVVTTGRELQTFFSLGRTPGGADQFGHIEDGVSINNDAVEACLPWAGRAVSFGDPEIQLGDMNGDGLQDIVKLQSGRLRYWPGRGNGVWGTGPLDRCTSRTFARNTDVLMTASPISLAGGLRLDDVNGDGLDDLLEVATNSVKVWLNVNGTGWTSAYTLKNTPANPDFGNRMRVLDLNGSGTRDLVWASAGNFKYIDLQGGERPGLLKRVSNGLGKSTDIEYSTSTREMMAAEREGGACSSSDWNRPWCQKMPIVAHVVKRVTESDNLQVAGFGPNRIVTEYQYRDPVYDGRQREFRGFKRARTKAVGDAISPTAFSESQFLLGECVAEAPGGGACADPATDNPREALKGLPIVSEQYDESGAYLSTEATTYRLRLLYRGRDGREVRHAYQTATRRILYDTAVASAGTGADSFNAVELERERDTAFNPQTAPKGLPAGLVFEPEPLVLRATTGTARIETRSHVDYFGNQVMHVAFGCTAGSACLPAANPPVGLDPNQAIYSSTVAGRPANDVTRWLHRTVSSSTWGDYRTAVRHATTITYDPRGNPLTVKKTLAGVTALLRSHRTLTGTGVVAPAPAGASTNGVKTLVTNTYDTLGNLTKVVGANGRCRTLTYDSTPQGFKQLVTVEQVFTTPGCTGNSLSTGAAYDRGLAQPTVITDATGQATYATYDHFGRLTSLTRPRPSGTGTPQPSVTLAYNLATPERPYSYIETNTQDAANVDTAAYRWHVSFIDGMGRTRLTRSEADKAGGRDLQNTIQDGFVTFTARGAVERKYLAQFVTLAKTAPLPTAITASFARSQYDAFGRVTKLFDLSTNGNGVQTVQNVYHALSQDVYDAADLGLDTGRAHEGTYASEGKDGHGRTITSTERVKVGAALDEREVRRQYLPSGELVSITRVHVGSLDPVVVRWMRYDTFGRMVLNVDPHTTKAFSANQATNPSLAGMRPWIYAYNDAGDLVGTSDARGCGSNYSYDAAGRLVTEDYSPCEATHAPYSAPDVATHTGIEVFYQYDALPTSFSDAVEVPPGSEEPNPPASSPTLIGRLAAVYDRSGVQVMTYDARGRATRLERRIANPDPSVVDPSSRYRGRWYATETGYDSEDRVVLQTTGAASEEFLVNGESALSVEYSARGTVKRISGSYGELVKSVKRSADGLIEEVVYGDAASTTATQTYDARRWLSTSRVTRLAPALWDTPPADYLPAPAPTGAPSSFQRLLRDEKFGYDIVGNPKSITDLRAHGDWPAGAKPVSRVAEYDDLYRVTRVGYAYSTGTTSTDDSFVSPFASELAGASDPRQSSNVPTHLLHAQRVKAQTLEYDWLGSLVSADDDTHTTWDRGVGPISTHASSGRPYQWKNSGTLASASWTGSGNAEALAYDESGNLLDLTATKVGTCSNGATSCTVRFTYEWDEPGRLSRAYRTEGVAAAAATEADLSFTYDYSDNRVLKSDNSASGAGPGSSTPADKYTVYLFGSLELRRASYNQATGDYLRDATTETPFLTVADQGLGRVTFEDAGNGEPRIAGNRLHVFLNIADYLGSASIVVDRSTGELVERRAYLAYGATENDYRPARWKGFREDYGFTGKEEDIEVGLQYFGKRYLSPYLGRWASADPLAVHSPGQADLNLYAYVHGTVLKSVDPLGLEEDFENNVSFQPTVSSASTGLATDGKNIDVPIPMEDPRKKAAAEKIETSAKDPGENLNSIEVPEPPAVEQPPRPPADTSPNFEPLKVRVGYGNRAADVVGGSYFIGVEQNPSNPIRSLTLTGEIGIQFGFEAGMSFGDVSTGETKSKLYLEPRLNTNLGFASGYVVPNSDGGISGKVPFKMNYSPSFGTSVGVVAGAKLRVGEPIGEVLETTSDTVHDATAGWLIGLGVPASLF
jgi:RHS repeat-associated protein